MSKKKTRKPEAVPVKNLPAKAIDGKSGEAVKGGDTTPRVDHGDLKITKHIDIASPKLYE